MWSWVWADERSSCEVVCYVVVLYWAAGVCALDGRRGRRRGRRAVGRGHAAVAAAALHAGTASASVRRVRMPSPPATMSSMYTDERSLYESLSAGGDRPISRISPHSQPE